MESDNSASEYHDGCTPSRSCKKSLCCPAIKKKIIYLLELKKILTEFELFNVTRKKCLD